MKNEVGEIRYIAYESCNTITKNSEAKGKMVYNRRLVLFPGWQREQNLARCLALPSSESKTHSGTIYLAEEEVK